MWRLDCEGGTRGTATGLAWKEDHQWARTLDEGWSLEKVRRVVVGQGAGWWGQAGAAGSGHAAWQGRAGKEARQLACVWLLEHPALGATNVPAALACTHLAVQIRQCVQEVINRRGDAVFWLVRAWGVGGRGGGGGGREGHNGLAAPSRVRVGLAGGRKPNPAVP